MEKATESLIEAREQRLMCPKCGSHIFGAKKVGRARFLVCTNCGAGPTLRDLHVDTDPNDSKDDRA